jgi:hypothetical protein
VKWLFRKRPRLVDPLPGEFIDLSTPEGRARSREIMAGRTRRRPSPRPVIAGITHEELTRYVVEGRGPD